MKIRRKRTQVVALGAAILLPTALLLTAQTANAAPSGLVKVDGTMPRWITPAASQRNARERVANPDARGSQQLDVRVYLAPQGGQQALVEHVNALSEPTSADYGHFMSAAAYEAAYEPTAATATSVQRYLQSNGLAVTGVETHRRYVAARGSVNQLNRAFHVTLRQLRHGKQQVIAPTTAASLPASVASQVLTVSGLDTTTVKMTHRKSSKVTPPAGFANARPCNINYGTVKARYQADYRTPLPKFRGEVLPYAVCGYTGPQLRATYEGDTTLSGQGVTVAITDAYRWQLIAKDANRYAEAHGDGSYVPGQLTENVPAFYTNQKACGPSGWSGEETLDVEAVHAMAPDAHIRYYASKSCFDDDFVDTLARVVDENTASIVSNSWGDTEANTTADSVIAYSQVVLQGAAQGISFLFSSGDNGDEVANTGLKQADFPASLPYVTAVGGTSTGIGVGGTRLFDAGWGTQKYSLSSDGKSWTPAGYLYGAGGGYSALFNRPAYQNGVVPPTAQQGRAVPDVAMDADPTTGMLIGQTQTFPDSVRYGEYRIGGTSLASPLFAGMTALASQSSNGGRFGQLNPQLYAAKGIADDVKKTPRRLGNVRVDYVNGVDATDGLTYSVRTFGQDSSLPVTKGWDAVTGIGVPNTSYFTKLVAPNPASAAVAAARR